MFADHRHPQVRPVLAAIGFGRRETPVSRLVGTARRLLQQRLPLVTRQTLIVPVGAAMLAAMVEEADIVVSCLKRLDLGSDEGVEFVQIARTADVEGKRVSVRLDLGGRRIITNKK